MTFTKLSQNPTLISRRLTGELFSIEPKQKQNAENKTEGKVEEWFGLLVINGIMKMGGLKIVNVFYAYDQRIFGRKYNGSENAKVQG